MEELASDIDLLNKAKIENNINEVTRLLKKIGQHLWQNISREDEITLQTADRCLSVYKIYKATNKIAKKDIVTTQKILALKDFLFKRVLQSNNEPVNFFTRIDDLYKSLEDIQFVQAKSVIHKAQEVKKNYKKS